MKLPVYNVVISNNSFIDTMSLVEAPAVETDFQVFEKQKLDFTIDEEQRIIFGCALRANFPIYRNGPAGGYFLVFTPDVIKHLYEDFMIKGFQNNVNLDHDHDKYQNKICLIQSLIKREDLGISPLGFEDVENGSWFVGYKVLDDEVWEQVKNGEFKGFSVEAYLDIVPAPQSDEVDELIDEMLK